MKQINSRW